MAADVINGQFVLAPDSRVADGTGERHRARLGSDSFLITTHAAAATAAAVATAVTAAATAACQCPPIRSVSMGRWQ